MQGSLENRQYEDKEGNTRYSLEITAEAVGPDLRFHVASPMKPTEVASTKQAPPKSSPFKPESAPIEQRLEQAREAQPEIDPDDVPF